MLLPSQWNPHPHSPCTTQVECALWRDEILVALVWGCHSSTQVLSLRKCKNKTSMYCVYLSWEEVKFRIVRNSVYLAQKET